MKTKKMKNTETKQTVREVFSNNGFLLKLIFMASPSFLIFLGLDSIRNQVSIFFEHTVLIGYVLEGAEFNYPFRKVAGVILLLAACITLGMVFTVLAGDFIQEKERPKVRRAIKMRLYKKAKGLDLECYDNPDFYNDQVMAISEVDRQIDRGVIFVQNTLSGLVMFLTTGGYFLKKDPVSILFAFAAFIISFVATKELNKRNFKVRVESIPFSRKRDYIKRIFYLNDYAKEIRLNPDVSDILYERFDQANDEVYKIEKKYCRQKAIFDFIKSYVSNNLVGDLIYISYLVYHVAVLKDLSLSAMAILWGSFGRLKHGLRVFTDTYPYAVETSLYVGKIRKFLGYEPKIVQEKGDGEGEVACNGDKEAAADGVMAGAGTNVATAKDVELKNVSFGYGKDKLTLKNLNMHFKPGEKIALVGYNGAGKTTLVKLLMRLYDVTQGEILSDGVNIKTLEPEKYRSTIGTVFQDFQIFAGNVKENVILDTEENINLPKVRESLEASGLLERADCLVNGLDTGLTTEFAEDGLNLSGGEAQKLAIARVFYKDAGLMILDEPSSALDPIAEYQLNHTMLEATKDKTVIFISHRLSTTRLADRIIMLEKGEIVEEGTHEELLARDGKYAQMWKLQAGAYIAV